MKKRTRIILVVLFSMLLSGMIVSHITAQQKKWVVYHGDFASFKIRWDYDLKYEKKGEFFTYVITDPAYPDNPLYITNGHRTLKYRLDGKAGYKTQVSGNVKVANTRGVQKSGVTDQDLNWREVFLYYSTKGAMGPDSKLIYLAYDKAPGALSVNFNEIINSMEVKDPIQTEIKGTYP